MGAPPQPDEDVEDGQRTDVADLPAESITWYRAKGFLARLDELGPVGWRLPSEVEWEYACRAGTRTAFSCGDAATIQQVNYDGRYPLSGAVSKDTALYRGGVVPVRSLPPNPWGLYEMHGNVFEWCEDVYLLDPVHGKPPADPTASRVIRGGAWNSMAMRSRSGHRDGYPPESAGSKYGFRAAWSPPR
jgi:sulfatase modifying factor 1